MQTPNSSLLRVSKFKLTVFIYKFLIVVAYCNTLAAADSVDMYISYAPPFTLIDEDDYGIIGDIAIRAIEVAGYDVKLKKTAWLRAQKEVSAGQNLLIVPLTRTQHREGDYTWIAPIIQVQWTFASLGEKIESFDDAKNKHKIIAVGLGSAQETKLHEEGFPDSQIRKIKIGESPAKLLLKGRVDAWFNSTEETRYIWSGVSIKKLIFSPPLVSANLYLACSKVCDKEMAEKLRQAIGLIKNKKLAITK